MDQNPFICFPGDGSGAPARVREQDASSPSAAPGQDALPAQAGAAGTAARAGLGPQAPGGGRASEEQLPHAAAQAPLHGQEPQHRGPCHGVFGKGLGPETARAGALPATAAVILGALSALRF